MERNLSPPPRFLKVCFLEMLPTGVPPNWHVLSRNYDVHFSAFKSEEKVDEKMVLPGNMVLTFTNDFGMLKEHTVEVRLLDKDFNLLASVSQPVVEF